MASMPNVPVSACRSPAGPSSKSRETLKRWGKPMSQSKDSESTGELSMKDLVQYIAQALVDFPDKVEVAAMESQSSVILELKVAPEDVGKVIGKGGQTAKAMRKILSAAATKLHKKSLLQIIE
jgi:hypothetical protein